MNKFIENLINPLVIGVVAAILVFVDSLIAPLFLVGASFTWVAFINWTVFFSASKVERIKAILGYIIGYLSANAIIIMDNYLNNVIDFKLINIGISTIISVFIINLLIMYFDKAKKLFFDSIPAIFVGIALTFSGVGKNLESSNGKLLVIIIIYGILGLLCGLCSNILVKSISSKYSKLKAK